jgi:hypothetical protein
MLTDIKEEILSVLNLRLMMVVVPAAILSILTAMAMYSMGYPSMVYGEVLLILKTLMHLILGVWSALNAILYGIVVFGLLIILLLPVLIILREVQKKRNEPPAVSDPLHQPLSSDTADPMRH